jgi:hypothetical protein
MALPIIKVSRILGTDQYLLARPNNNEAENILRAFHNLEDLRWQNTNGVADIPVICPDNWEKKQRC